MGKRREEVEIVPFVVAPDDPLAPMHALIERAEGQGTAAAAAREQLGELSRSDQCRAIQVILQRMAHLLPLYTAYQQDAGRFYEGGEWLTPRSAHARILGRCGRLEEMLEGLLKRKQPLDEADLQALLGWANNVPWYARFGGVLKQLESHCKGGEPSAGLVAGMRRLFEKLTAIGYGESKKWAARLGKLIGGPDGPPLLQPGEAWSDAALAAIGAPERAAWTALLEHCERASGGKPSARWQKVAGPLIEAVGRERFREALLEWFPLVDEPRTAPIEDRPEWAPDPNLMLIDRHADILKGLAWCCGLAEDGALARALTALALSAYRKVPGVGPRAVKVGNACVHALGAMPGMEGVGQLALLKVRVKFRTAQKGIEKALRATAERVGISREELEEMAVPAYGLTEVGRRSETLGEFTGELIIRDSASTELRWLKPDGKPQKSVPAAVKRDHAEALAELKSANKDIQKMLPAQRERLDNLFLAQKRWRYETWRERYLDHPLVGSLARRLIWLIDDEATIYHDGRHRRSDGSVLETPGPEATVALWHPIPRSTEQVVAWREWLALHGVQQPFKQAHREVYLLTDAERRTGVYSNRFAGHVLRQHQFNALCAARGWRNTLRLMVDDFYRPPTRELPGWGLRAEYWVEGAGEEFGADTNEAGVFHYLATDQVRFYPIDSAQREAHAGGGGYEPSGEDAPLPLEQVPPLVLSEVMRDVDLFVGVGSVGNDPRWADGGPDGRYREYWQAYAFGDLSQTAQTRKQVLEQLVPRLKVADRCRFEGKFLVVEGRLRTYKIHLGSSNILMSPDDRYLCIVRGHTRKSAATSRLFLPFEGDATMALILSKLFLLADDEKITDETIMSQIR